MTVRKEEKRHQSIKDFVLDLRLEDNYLIKGKELEDFSEEK